MFYENTTPINTKADLVEKLKTRRTICEEAVKRAAAAQNEAFNKGLTRQAGYHAGYRDSQEEEYWFINNLIIRLEAK